MYEWYLESVNGNEDDDLIPIITLERNIEFLVGRKQTHKVVCFGPLASRFHAVIKLEDDGFVYIKDTNSSNGVYINDIRVQRNEFQRLRDGDVIGIGAPSYCDNVSKKEFFHLRKREIQNGEVPPQPDQRELAPSVIIPDSEPQIEIKKEDTNGDNEIENRTGSQNAFTSFPKPEIPSTSKAGTPSTFSTKLPSTSSTNFPSISSTNFASTSSTNFPSTSSTNFPSSFTNFNPGRIISLDSDDEEDDEIPLSQNINRINIVKLEIPEHIFKEPSLSTNMQSEETISISKNIDTKEEIFHIEDDDFVPLSQNNDRLSPIKPDLSEHVFKEPSVSSKELSKEDQNAASTSKTTDLKEEIFNLEEEKHFIPLSQNKDRFIPIKEDLSEPVLKEPMVSSNKNESLGSTSTKTNSKEVISNILDGLTKIKREYSDEQNDAREIVTVDSDDEIFFPSSQLFSNLDIKKEPIFKEPTSNDVISIDDDDDDIMFPSSQLFVNHQIKKEEPNDDILEVEDNEDDYNIFSNIKREDTFKDEHQEEDDDNSDEEQSVKDWYNKLSQSQGSFLIIDSDNEEKEIDIHDDFQDERNTFEFKKIVLNNVYDKEHEQEHEDDVLSSIQKEIDRIETHYTQNKTHNLKKTDILDAEEMDIDNEAANRIEVEDIPDQIVTESTYSATENTAVLNEKEKQDLRESDINKQSKILCDSKKHEDNLKIDSKIERAESSSPKKLFDRQDSTKENGSKSKKDMLEDLFGPIDDELSSKKQYDSQTSKSDKKQKHTAVKQSISPKIDEIDQIFNKINNNEEDAIVDKALEEIGLKDPVAKKLEELFNTQMQKSPTTHSEESVDQVEKISTKFEKVHLDERKEREDTKENRLSLSKNKSIVNEDELSQKYEDFFARGTPTVVLERMDIEEYLNKNKASTSMSWETTTEKESSVSKKIDDLYKEVQDMYGKKKLSKQEKRERDKSPNSRKFDQLLEKPSKRTREDSLDTKTKEKKQYVKPPVIDAPYLKKSRRKAHEPPNQEIEKQAPRLTEKLKRKISIDAKLCIPAKKLLIPPQNPSEKIIRQEFGKRASTKNKRRSTSIDSETKQHIKEQRKEALKKLSEKNLEEKRNNRDVKKHKSVPKVKTSDSRGLFLTAEIEKEEPKKKFVIPKKKPSSTVAAHKSVAIDNIEVVPCPKPVPITPIIPTTVTPQSVYISKSFMKSCLRQTTSTKKKLVSFKPDAALVETRLYEIDEENKLKPCKAKDAPFIMGNNINNINNKYSYQATEEDSLFNILSWHPKWLEEQKQMDTAPKVSQHRPMQMLYKFNSAKDYFLIVNPLLLLELWTSIFRDWQCLKRDCFTAEITSIGTTGKSKNVFTRLECVSFITEREHKLHPIQGDLIIIEMMLNNGLNEIVTKFGYITNAIKRKISQHDSNIYNHHRLAKVRKKHEVLDSSVYYTITLKGMSENINKDKIIRLRAISYIAPCLRIFRTVAMLGQSPLCNHILKPEIENFKVPKVTDTTVMLSDDLNSIQKQSVLEASQMCLGNEPGIYLLQGPPGTGKSKVVQNIILQLLYGEKSYKRSGKKILFCAPSNGAVDEITMRLCDIRSKFENSCSQ